MDADVAIHVEHVSKKYCKSLKRSMRYGVQDIAKNMIGLSSHSDRLRKHEFWAVDTVSFEVKKGEVLALIGPNGSGKTTLLKMLNGIFWPDKGKISVRGRVGALIAVGAGFHPLLTGRENIYINAAILGMTKREVDKKFDDIVEFADIGDFLDTPVKFYSSGMFVRLGFAVAVHCEPDILLVDEVLAVGDTRFRRKSSERMSELIESGDRSIILVSHYMQTVEGLADTALLLNAGKMVTSGTAREVIAEYELMMRPKDIDEESTVDQTPSDKGELVLVKKYEGYAGDEVALKHVWLEDSDGGCRTQFSGDEDIAVCISYENRSNVIIQNGVFWVTFVNEYGVNCMGARVTLGEQGLPKELPKSGILRVWFRPLQLTTSSYKLSIVFFDRTFTIPYAQAHYGHIKVRNDKSTATPGVNSPVCWPRCEWDLDPVQK